MARIKIWKFEFVYVDLALCPICNQKVEDFKQHLISAHSHHELVNFIFEHSKKVK